MLKDAKYISPSKDHVRGRVTSPKERDEFGRIVPHDKISKNGTPPYSREEPPLQRLEREWWSLLECDGPLATQQGWPEIPVERSSPRVAQGNSGSSDLGEMLAVAGTHALSRHLLSRPPGNLTLLPEEEISLEEASLAGYLFRFQVLLPVGWNLVRNPSIQRGIPRLERNREEFQNLR